MRRLILLLSVGWVLPCLAPSGACLTLGASLLSQPPQAVAGYTTPGLRLFRCPEEPFRVPRFSVLHATTSRRRLTRQLVPPGQWPTEILAAHGPWPR
jgi:hypothetical protein